MSELSNELKSILMAKGLSKQQAESATARACVEAFMEEDGRVLIAEARNIVESLKRDYDTLRNKLYDLTQKIEGACSMLQGISEASREYGEVTEEKAKTTVALFAALLNMGIKAGADPDRAVDAASYPVYAYLGGQATRQINYDEK